MAADEAKDASNNANYINNATKTPFPKIANNEESWLESRLELLKAEKEFSKARAALAKKRRAMPVKLVEKDYVFEDSADGSKVTLSSLFNKDNNNLIVYHLMFDESWDKPCSTCSFWLDGINGSLPHILSRSQVVVIGKANHDKLKKAKEWKKWDFRLLSSKNNTFNVDFGAECNEDTKKNGKGYNYNAVPNWFGQMPGVSVFVRNEKDRKVYHSYSTYGPGMAELNVMFGFLDVLPEGRCEKESGKQNHWWVKHKDEY